jgi:hypothetical protein
MDNNRRGKPLGAPSTVYGLRSRDNSVCRSGPDHDQGTADDVRPFLPRICLDYKVLICTQSWPPCTVIVDRERVQINMPDRQPPNSHRLRSANQKEGETRAARFQVCNPHALFMNCHTRRDIRLMEPSILQPRPDGRFEMPSAANARWVVRAQRDMPQQYPTPNPHWTSDRLRSEQAVW